MKPIFPMEPVASNIIPGGNEWVANIKWDGVRILTYFDGHSVSLFNRKQNNRTNQYPELLDIKSYCDAKSAILDGEVIALSQDGMPSFHEVMRRDGIRRLDKVSFMRNQVPIAYMVFDVIFHNGIWLTKTPYDKRMNLLKRILRPNESVQIVQAYRDCDELFRVMKKKNMEGIVVKRKDSLYLPGEKKDVWRKIKNYKDVLAVIGGFTMKDGTVNSVLIGVYHEDNLYYIGHVGTGKLSNQEWIKLTKWLMPIVISDKPFVNHVNHPERRKGTYWTVPEICVKVQFMEWTSGHSLRQPSIQAIVDISPIECIL